MATGARSPSTERREKWPQRSPDVLQTLTSLVVSVLTKEDGADTATSDCTAVRCAGHAPTTLKASGWALMVDRGLESIGPPWSSPSPPPPRRATVDPKPAVGSRMDGLELCSVDRFTVAPADLAAPPAPVVSSITPTGGLRDTAVSTVPATSRHQIQPPVSATQSSRPPSQTCGALRAAHASADSPAGGTGGLGEGGRLQTLRPTISSASPSVSLPENSAPGSSISSSKPTKTGSAASPFGDAAPPPAPTAVTKMAFSAKAASSFSFRFLGSSAAASSAAFSGPQSSFASTDTGPSAGCFASDRVGSCTKPSIIVRALT
mmetsp:Transcript_150996/g.485255  ORF Transcript_150996/g.485255 Transcript_150996/m.485255 type:complete len:319 (+) Transcript_150996:990-1946(+)